MHLSFQRPTVKLTLSSEIAELEATALATTPLATGSRRRTRQQTEIVNLETEIDRIHALLADPRPLAIARHDPTLYVVDPCVDSAGLSNFGKTYAELFGEFCQLVGDTLEDEDIPIFMKETEMEDGIYTGELAEVQRARMRFDRLV